MYRVLFAALATAALLSTGCAVTGSIRQQRARKSLGNPEPQPANSVVDQWPDPNPVTLTPPSTTPYQDRLANRDIDLRLPEAVARALSHSGIVRVSRGDSVEASSASALDVAADYARTHQALAAFDASLEVGFVGSKTNRPPNAFFGPGLVQPLRRDEAAFNAGLTKPLRNGGVASLFFNPDPGYLFIPQPDPTIFNPRHVGRLEFGIEQPLLRNAGLAFNGIPIKIAQIATKQSAWEFKQSAMESVRSVCVAYWDLFAAKAALESIDNVIPLLEEVVWLQEAAFTTEWVIEADVAKAYAQLHRFQEERLARLSDVAEVELRLRSLVGVPPADGTNLNPETPPLASLFRFDPAMLLDEAMANQPELVRQRLDVRLRKLELMQAENDLLPNLDFVALYRMNGVGDKLGNALEQMASAEFSDWELGALFTVPIGRRSAKAGVRAAEQELIRETRLLQQRSVTVMHNLNNHLQQLDYAYRRLETLDKQLAAAEKWVEGAHLRYQNPNPAIIDSDGLLTVLNDYLAALRFRTDAAAERAAIVARYNVELVRLEETKGTLLSLFGIDFTADPCVQSAWFQSATTRRCWTGNRIREARRPLPRQLARTEIRNAAF